MNNVAKATTVKNRLLHRYLITAAAPKVGISHTNECPFSADIDRIPQSLSASKRNCHHQRTALNGHQLRTATSADQLVYNYIMSDVIALTEYSSLHSSLLRLPLFIMYLVRLD